MATCAFSSAASCSAARSAAHVAEHTAQEIAEQARKACRYFGAGLEKNGKGFFAVEVDGVILAVARGEKAKLMEEGIMERALLGPGAVIHRAPPPAAPEEPPAAEPEPEAQDGPGDHTALLRPLEPVEEVVLIPMYHSPPPEHAKKRGHVHLHVLNDAKLGRRERRSGECLCSKKHGSDERLVDDESRRFDMCEECVRVARENGITWSF